MVAALGFLLLIPLQTIAGLQTSRTANNAQSSGIQGAEAKLKALHQAVAGAASNADLNQQLQKLQRVGVFGSYGRGDAGVGSDLDLLLLHWPLAELPLSCDALVLTPAEHANLMAGGSAMAAALERECCWLWERGPHAPEA